MAAERTEQSLLAITPQDETTLEQPRQTLESLIQVNRDAAEGFAAAADRLERADHAATFRSFAAERTRFADELVDAGSRFLAEDAPGDSVASKLHRAWIGVKDVLTSGDHAILAAAEAGEDHAVATYAEALETNLPTDFGGTVRSQYTSVKQAHDTVREMRDKSA